MQSPFILDNVLINRLDPGMYQSRGDNFPKTGGGLKQLKQVLHDQPLSLRLET